MKNLFVRACTGAVYAALSLGAAWAGRNTTFLLFLPVCMLAAAELHRLLRPNEGGQAWSALLAGIGYGAFGALALHGYWRPTHAFLVIAVLFVTSTLVAFRSGPGLVARSNGIALMVLVLIALPFAALTHLAGFGPWALAGFLIILWANDTGAYLAGSAFGRTRLIPAISPGKSVEGLAGGAIAAMAAAWCVAQAETGFPMFAWLMAAGAIVITATVGDLMESAWKRAAGVKDSGALLPGHGGVLDRFDGLLIAAPVHWALLVLAGAPA